MTEQENIIKVSNKVVAKTAGKEETMKNERIVSLGIKSMIYHKPGCRYVERIKYKKGCRSQRAMPEPKDITSAGIVIT